MNEMTLGQRIRQRRKQIGLSQNELSKAAGVSDSSISLWESDNTAPRGENLHKLATVLQCSPTWILFGDDDKIPDEPQSSAVQQLNEDEQELLQLYRALPESEQKAQKSNMRARVKNFNRLFNELLEARKRNSQQ
ncbi:transcriptional regulator [Buttiauxella ferragutiae ATCC 51602]|uniref:Transcriptional regulator n=1 Tax=Buttiauxella ferragutiae ATCC 51602 TaxID=1354252 RepID=A0ABX2W6W2_9ENTR|nr:helix-turn-helix domain-containing protein [Buttiauxella ferragutiae]OAT26697.1 transcriptional regulator [Buttiauxella ferragutiae ATCC 51602]